MENLVNPKTIFNKYSNLIFLILVTILGIIMPILPQIGTISIIILGVIIFIFKINYNKNSTLSILYLFWSSVHFLMSFRRESISGIFEAILPFFLYLGFNWLIPKWNEKYLVLGTLIGLFFICTFNLFSFWQPTDQPWSVDPNLGKSILRTDSILVTPIAKTDSWILKPLDLHGSGEITYAVEIKAQRSIRLNTFIIQADAIEKRKNDLCDVQITWTRCEISYVFQSTRGLYFGVGTQGTWKVGDPTLELRQPEVVNLRRSSFLQRIADTSRVSGFMFNENAFGATVALIGILALGIAKKRWIGIITALMSVFAVMMSGSRGALIAFILGIVVLLISKSRFYKIMPIIVVLILFLVILSQVKNWQSKSNFSYVNPTPAVRLLDTSDSSSIRTRVEIWRLAFKSWSENTTTILFGTGNLQLAMQSHLDTRAIGAGFTKQTITHAHNLWLQTLGESGLIGLLALLGLWIWVFINAWKKLDATALAILVGISIINSLDYLFFFSSVQCMFWMCAVGFQSREKPKKTF